MQQAIQAILALNSKEMKVFFSEMFSDTYNLADGFLKFLKAASNSERNELFIAIDNPGLVNWGRSKYSKVETATPEELSAIILKITDLAGTVPAKRSELETNTVKAKALVMEYREIMKAGFEKMSDSLTDQNEGIKVPPVQKEVPTGAEVIQLPAVDRSILSEVDIFNCLNNRKSRRQYLPENLSLAELSFLLWATQGVQGKFNNDQQTIRTVPSGGARQPFETYLAINRVADLKPGIYRYQPLEHQLVYLFSVEDQVEKVADAAHGQGFVGDCAVTFIWSTIPYRCEWRYTVESKKIILQDSGHLCQNLYIACEAIGCGTCAIGAYNQQKFDSLLQLDGIDEFTVYVAPVGKVKKPKPTVKLTDAELTQFCGYYWCEAEMLSRKIYLKEGFLYYWRNEESESRLVAVGKNEFRMADADADLTFTTVDGKNQIHFVSEGDSDLHFIAYEPDTQLEAK